MAKKPQVPTMRGQLKPGDRKSYALAGKATVTLRSLKTGIRFTYRIKKHKTEDIHFVGILTGPDNTASYQYLGTIFPDGFRVTKKSNIKADAPSAKAFDWFAKNMEHAAVEVWHEGACGRCGRKLTVPESIERGLGPTCDGRHAPVVETTIHPLQAAVKRALINQQLADKTKDFVAAENLAQLNKIHKAFGATYTLVSGLKSLAGSPWVAQEDGSFTTDYSDLRVALEGREAASCPKCCKSLSGTMHAQYDKENECTHFTGTHTCGTQLTVFND